MVKLVTILIPAAAAIAALKVFFMPVRMFLKLIAHGVLGLICLLLLNALSEYTGILFPVNAFTVLLAGFLGAPGICLMAIMQLL